MAATICLYKAKAMLSFVWWSLESASGFIGIWGCLLCSSNMGKQSTQFSALNCIDLSNSDINQSVHLLKQVCFFFSFLCFISLFSSLVILWCFVSGVFGFGFFLRCQPWNKPGVHGRGFCTEQEVFLSSSPGKDEDSQEWKAQGIYPCSWWTTWSWKSSSWYVCMQYPFRIFLHVCVDSTLFSFCWFWTE